MSSLSTEIEIVKSHEEFSKIESIITKSKNKEGQYDIMKIVILLTNLL